MLSSFILSTLVVWSGLSQASVLSRRSGPNSAPYLNRAAQAAGKLWFGTATAIPGAEQQDMQYMKILNNTNIWGQLTPTDFMKWLFTEPQQGSFNYAGGDIVLDIAAAHNKSVRCHNLVWDQELPNWVTGGTWTNATLIAAMKQHIENVVLHWGSKCHSWDVVNEALNDDGTSKPTIFYNTIGPAYVPLAFQFASDAVKKTKAPIKLFYNDFGIEFPGPKNNAAQGIVKDLQRRGIQIDGVGFESHFLVGQTPSMAGQVTAMKAMTSLRVEVQQTEIDVRFTSLPPTTVGLAQQAADYYSTVSACMAVNGCTGMTVWDFDDKYSWIVTTYPGQGVADLYDNNLRRKLAYQAVWEAIKGYPCSVCG